VDSSTSETPTPKLRHLTPEQIEKAERRCKLHVYTPGENDFDPPRRGNHIPMDPEKRYNFDK
jgi:hypothetical protein